MLTSLKLPDRDVSILFVSDRQIQRLNNKFFGRDRPTNVISFSYLAPPESASAPAGAREFPCEMIGDIVISLERTAEEAELMAVSFHERLLALIIHGLLHILGFDHEKGGNERRKMRYREKKLLTYVTSHSVYKEIAL